MTHPHVANPAVNPFDQAPAESAGKMTFGTLRIITNKVNLVSGASYVVQDLGFDSDPNSPVNRLTDQNGNLREFRGKQLTPGGRDTHVIVVITTRHRDGTLYNACRDFMYWQKDKSQRITMPSLQRFFGSKLAGIFGKSAEVQAEVVNYTELSKKVDPVTGERREYPRQAFKIIKVFKTKEERETAEAAFFSQFNPTADQIADDIPGFESEDDKPMPWEPEDKPVGMAREDAVKLLPTLWAASGQDKDKFIAQLNSMPVVLTALGGIDAPEVKDLTG